MEPKTEKNSTHNMICGQCGSQKVKTVWETYTFPYGSGEDSITLSCEAPIRHCQECGFCFMDAEAEDICHETICKHLGVMPPSKIRQIRELHRLTQAEFADLTKLGEATVSRWERGLVIQNQANDNYLYLLGFDDNIQRLRNRNRQAEFSDARAANRLKFRAINPDDENLRKRQEAFVLHI